MINFFKKLFKKCQHEWDKGKQIGYDKYFKCLKCGKERIVYNYDYPVPE